MLTRPLLTLQANGQRHSLAALSASAFGASPSRFAAAAALETNASLSGSVSDEEDDEEVERSLIHEEDLADEDESMVSEEEEVDEEEVEEDEAEEEEGVAPLQAPFTPKVRP